jgi:polysaccharide export outer membrane protein
MRPWIATPMLLKPMSIRLTRDCYQMFAYLKTVIFTVYIVCSFFALSYTAVAEPLPQSSVSSEPALYKIGPGDVLQISVWKEDGMDIQTLVKPDGGITFPLAGDIQASGLTTQQLTDALTTRLKRYIPNPVVTVSVLQSVSNKVYVIGKVNRPGEYKATNYMDVLQALSMAGGLTPYADSDEIKIIRQHNGKKEVFSFDYDEVISGEKLEMNIKLEAGDTVAVP